jgi:hypothetical protein
MTVAAGYVPTDA